MDDDNIIKDDDLNEEVSEEEIDPLAPKKKPGLLDDDLEEPVESLDKLADEEEEIDADLDEVDNS